MLLKQMSKVALVIEPGRRGNLRDRILSLRQLARSPIEPEPANILAHCGPVVFFERAREMCRMHAYGMGDLDKIKRIVEVSMQ